MLLKINSLDGMIMNSLVGILVVFGALTLLVIIFEIIQKLNARAIRIKVAKASGKHQKEITDFKDVNSDEIAAISMALHLYLHDVHDEESNVITIKRIQRRYSPWNSKLYGMTNYRR